MPENLTSIALYQPDIPQNAGAMIRLCACMNVHLEIIEPCGFPWNERKIKKSAMDYIDKLQIKKHTSWNAFSETNKDRRIILMTTKAAQPYIDFTFRSNDILLAGSESAGVPEDIHNSANARILIPMQPGMRSMNVVNATSMILGEALRQTRWKE